MVMKCYSKRLPLNSMLNILSPSIAYCHHVPRPGFKGMEPDSYDIYFQYVWESLMAAG